MYKRQGIEGTDGVLTVGIIVVVSTLIIHISSLVILRKEITKQVSYELHALLAIKIFFKDFK